MEIKISFLSIVRFAIFLLAALSFQACDKKADSSLQPENGRESLSDPSIKPEIVATMPSNNAVGPFNTYAPGPNSDEPHFILHFNKYMNIASIKNLTVTCEGFAYPVRVIAIYDYYYYGYYWRRAGTVPTDPGSGPSTASPFRELIAFQIIRHPGYYRSANYEVGKTYTITVDSTIEDINGNHMSKPHFFSFTPEPSFRGTGTYPEDGSNETDMYYNTASVYFNSPITSDLLSSVHVTPAVPGTWNLNLSDSISASLPMGSQVSVWDFGKTYQISIDAGAADASGNVLPSEFKSTFSTAPFRVSYTDPADGGAMSYLLSSVYFSFNAALDTSTIRSAITVSPSPTGGMIYDFYYGSNYLYLHPPFGYNGGKTYSVTVASTLKAKNGTELQNPYVLHFATAPFRVQYTSPSNGESNFNRYSTMGIETNAIVSPTNLSSSISISPSAPIQWNASGGQSCWSSGVLAASTTYTVTVLPSFRSTAGDTLAVPYSFTFKTGP